MQSPLDLLQDDDSISLSEDVVVSIEISPSSNEGRDPHQPYWKSELENQKMKPTSKLFCLTTFRYMDVIARCFTLLLLA